MDCCADDGAREVSPHLTCPTCSGRGRKVAATTLDALLREGTTRGSEGYRFCPTVGCPTAYFGEATGHVIGVVSVAVRVGQKEDAPDRTLCYCFQFTAADVEQDAASAGGSTIVDEIKEHCRRGDDRCEVTNPQGACCLGNVRTVATRARLGGAPASIVPWRPQH